MTNPDHLEIARLTAELDKARAEIVRLCRQNDALSLLYRWTPAVLLADSYLVSWKAAEKRNNQRETTWRAAEEWHRIKSEPGNSTSAQRFLSASDYLYAAIDAALSAEKP